MRPVRPLPPTWVLSAGLTLICLLVAMTASGRLGFVGVAQLTPWERLVIFSALGILVWSAGTEFVSQLIPASRQRFTASAFLAVCTVVLLGAFALVFRDYHTERFISAGVACLLTGLLLAIPTGLLELGSAAAARFRGKSRCGRTRGRCTGGTGRPDRVGTSLCRLFRRYMCWFWHTAVVPVSAAGGALVGAEWFDVIRPNQYAVAPIIGPAPWSLYRRLRLPVVWPRRAAQASQRCRFRMRRGGETGSHH